MGTGQPVGARGHRRRDDHMRRPAYRSKSMRARGCRREARDRVCWVLVVPLLWDALSAIPAHCTTTRAHSLRCMHECADRAADAPLTLLRREHAGIPLSHSPALACTHLRSILPPPPQPPTYLHTSTELHLSPPHRALFAGQLLASRRARQAGDRRVGRGRGATAVPQHGNRGGRAKPCSLSAPSIARRTGCAPAMRRNAPSTTTAAAAADDAVDDHALPGELLDDAAEVGLARGRAVTTAGAHRRG